MDQPIQDFVNNKRIAIFGASRSGKKFGNLAAKELSERGYQVSLVHPEAQTIDGQTCYPNLASLQGKIDSVFISVPANNVEPIFQQASELGIKNVWLQQNAETPSLIAKGRELGLNLVYGKCILMYAPPVKSFHGFHRWVMKLFGKL
jgi:predicted CoA-binding protein